MSRKHIESIVKTHFDKDTSSHVMTVFRDDGVNRHIRFSRPDSGIFHFDLITWPGCLCYTGDMGTYVFKRLDDMFEFFRTDSGRINLGYWSEKLIAMNCSGRNGENSVEEFDGEAFKQLIREQRLEWIREAHREGNLDKTERRELWEALDELIDAGDGGEGFAVGKVYEFHWSPYGRGYDTKISYSFVDFWDNNIREYTHHFVWCCLAIAWGIRVYDEAAKQGGNHEFPQ